jgi:DNA-binding NarL/FixJ family response regulator
MKLTDRQKTILTLMCEDMNQKHIAFKLCCSTSLVEKEIKQLKGIFKVETNPGLIFNYLNSF